VHPFVCPCLFPNVVNSLSWKVLVVFSPVWNNDEFVSVKFWDQKVTVSSMLENALFGLVNAPSWKLLDWISPNLQRWCILGRGWTCQLRGHRLRSQHDHWLSRQRHTELDAMHQSLISRGGTCSEFRWVPDSGTRPDPGSCRIRVFDMWRLTLLLCGTPPLLLFDNVTLIGAKQQVGSYRLRDAIVSCIKDGCKTNSRFVFHYVTYCKNRDKYPDPATF